MECVVIIGCGGSGKSTLARRLSEKTGLPVVHLDKLWWRSGWTNPTREEFDQTLSEELEKPRWIMDGNYNRTLPQRLDKCDTAIFLDYSRWICLWGMLKRVLTHYGQVRPDMPQGCPERFDPEFIRWIWDFQKNVRPRNYELLTQAEREHGVRVVVLKTHREAERFLRTL